MRAVLLLVTVTMLTVTMAPAADTVISGRVTDSNGSGIADVDLDIIDRDNGQSLTLVNDDTDFLGFYAVTVPEGDYDVQFEPLPDDRYVGFEERGFRAQGPTANLDVTLESGWFLTGRVVDENLAPLASAKLDFVDASDGPIFVANNATDAAGNFSVVLLPSTLAMQIDPGPGSPLVPREVGGIVVGGDTAIGDQVLVEGHHLSGTLVDQTTMPGPIPIPGVRVETLDPATGAKIYNTRNTTNELGAFDIVVAPGPVNLRFIPPRGVVSLTRLLAGIDMQGAYALPTIALDEGVLASGTVLAPAAAPAQATDLDFLEQVTGFERFTPRDNVDDQGRYDVAVAPGSYKIAFKPPAASGWAPAQLDNVNLGSSANLPTVQLQPGRTVSGIVRDSAGVPLPGVDLDFEVTATGVALLTSQDKTDATGAFAVVVPADTYDIEFSPPALSGVGQLTLPSITVVGNLNVGTLTLPGASPAAASGVTPSSGSALGGTVVTVSGAGFAPGVKVLVGGATLSGVVIVNGTTLQGTTRVHPAGTFDVTVTNPGTAAVTLPAAFTYTTPAADLQLTVQRTGPLANDVLLQWNGSAGATYSLFRSFDPGAIALHDAVLGASYRDDGAGDPSAGTLLFYLVY